MATETWLPLPLAGGRLAEPRQCWGGGHQCRKQTLATNLSDICHPKSATYFPRLGGGITNGGISIGPGGSGRRLPGNGRSVGGGGSGIAGGGTGA